MGIAMENALGKVRHGWKTLENSLTSQRSGSVFWMFPNDEWKLVRSNLLKPESPVDVLIICWTSKIQKAILHG